VLREDATGYLELVVMKRLDTLKKMRAVPPVHPSGAPERLMIPDQSPYRWQAAYSGYLS
jgi:hypothetical protein